jgi:BirA family transcriptional regulator, biotin operon repressor / biotin---[acetyl-CoA-carboxylase] ligase
MQLPKSEQVFSELSFHQELDSTNLELARSLTPSTRHFCAVIAASQTAGLGRLGRSWESPENSSLSLSIFLSGEKISEPAWATLLAALAVKRAIAELGVIGSGVKWPNDVLVSGKKISGILAQLLPLGDVILGIGLNLTPQSSELELATSLAEQGVSVDLDTAAAVIGRQLAVLLHDFETNSAEVKKLFAQSCLTLGQEVRAELPGGGQVIGLASEIDSAGQLVILTPEALSLSAADVWHLRN